MRKVTEAVLATGVVDPATLAVLERWGLHGATEVATRPDLVKALEEVERLVGRERGAFRTAYPGLDMDPRRPWVFGVEDAAGNCYLCRWGVPGEIYVERRAKAPHLPEEGTSLQMATKERFYVSDGEKIYQGERVVAACYKVLERRRG